MILTGLLQEIVVTLTKQSWNDIDNKWNDIEIKLEYYLQKE